MSKKLFSMIFFVLLTALTGSALALDILWTNGSGNGLWDTATNWSPSNVPALGDKAKINITPGPLISSGTAAECQWLALSDGAPGDLRMTGGTLNVSGSSADTWTIIAYAPSDVGIFTMDGGTITTSSRFYVGFQGQATLNMNGGSLNIGGIFGIAYGEGWTTGRGYVYLAGGTITAADFQMASPAGCIGLLDITGGTLIITGDKTTQINGYASSGIIKAYGGIGTLAVDYNITNPGKTTVSASLDSQQAHNPSPASGDANISPSTVLGWTAGLGAASHDIYFGTDFSDVNSASRLLGDLDGSGTVDYNDLFILTDYWLADPFGSEPYAGINDDNIVDFFDYALLAQDFSDSASAAFKGNQILASYDPGPLALSTAYYWRIDEVNDAHPNSPWTGDVWSFTTQTGTATLEKGPYLIYPGNNTEMQVLWQLDYSETCSLAWGLDTNYSDGSTDVPEYGTDHQYEYTITGLTPGSKYYYKVTVGAGISTGTFMAAPANSATSLKFLMYGDTRTNVADQALVCAGMNAAIASDPAYQTILLLAGDWVETNAETNWTLEYFNRSYPALLQTQASVPITGTMGNHEGGGSVYVKYWPYPYVAAHYWSFDYGPVHIAVVDQYTSYTSGSAQYNWLVNDLSNSTKQWNIIVLHEPGWSCRGGHNNNTTVQSVIQPLCEQYDVQIVLGGHNHYYSRGLVNGVHHLTSGGGGAPLYTPKAGEPYIVSYLRSLNFQKVEINGNTLTYTSLKPDGTVIDTFTITK